MLKSIGEALFAMSRWIERLVFLLLCSPIHMKVPILFRSYFPRFASFSIDDRFVVYLSKDRTICISICISICICFSFWLLLLSSSNNTFCRWVQYTLRCICYFILESILEEVDACSQLLSSEETNSIDSELLPCLVLPLP